MERCVYYRIFSLENKIELPEAFHPYSTMLWCYVVIFILLIHMLTMLWDLFGPECFQDVTNQCLHLNTDIVFYGGWIKSNCYKGALFVTLFDLSFTNFLWILFALCLLLLIHLPFLLQTPSDFFHLHQSGSTNANQPRVFLSHSSDETIICINQ